MTHEKHQIACLLNVIFTNSVQCSIAFRYIKYVKVSLGQVTVKRT